MDRGIHFYHTLLLLEPINGMIRFSLFSTLSCNQQNERSLVQVLQSLEVANNITSRGSVALCPV